MKPSDPAQVTYAIDGGDVGKARLDMLHEVFGRDTVRFLHATGVKSGDSCIDFGCGGGHVSRELARIVGSSGHVIGIDFDARLLDLARADTQVEGLPNVTFEVGDARKAVHAGVDVAFSRFLLSHLAEPAEMLSLMKAIVRPGGKVIVEDIDMAASFTEPRDAAHERYYDLYNELMRRTGADGNLGRRLPLLATAAGLTDLAVRIHQPAHLSGALKRFTANTMACIRASVLDHGLATADDADTLIAHMNAFAERGGTLVAVPRVVQVAGTA